jgi:hypothetical protein
MQPRKTQELVLRTKIKWAVSIPIYIEKGKNYNNQEMCS